jgi:integrase
VSIEKKAVGKYQARWRDPAGRQRAKMFSRKIDAERWLASVTVDALQGRYVDPRAGRVTVAEYVARWAEGQPWRDTTRMSRESAIATQIVPTFGAMQLAAVRPSDVQAWVGRMTASGLASSSVGAYFRVFAQLMLAARRDKLIVESPCEGVKLPRADRGATALRVLTIEQVAAIAGAVPRHYRALVIVSAALGLRQGEACGLTVDRIDFLRRTVMIDRQVVTLRSNRDASLGPVKTPASNRRIPLPASVADVLAAHLAEFGEGPDRLVFTTNEGRMIGRQTWHAAFSAASRRVGVKASSHDLRHHAASLLISAGCSPRAVASFLGHKNATETLNTYSHLWPSDEGRIVAAIDEALAGEVHEVCTEGATTVG